MLDSYGWSDRQKAMLEECSGLIPGRVVNQYKERYRVVTDQGEVWGQISGKFRYRAEGNEDYPAVGDFVLLKCGDDLGVIVRILPRKSVFMRRAAGTKSQMQVVAANIDTVFICMALNNDYNLRRLERYVSIAWESGACPIIVLTKSDLCTDIEEKQLEVEKVAIGVNVIVTSSCDEEGFGNLREHIRPGQTAAFMGSSGVGKSTLINRLMGEERIKTNGLRNDDKGRHTTTHRELILLETGAMVIDTPGMRELGMWDDAEGIEKTFSDVWEIARNCRYSDCTHTNEPGCAIREALESGLIDESRYEAFLKLLRENEFAVDSQSYKESKEKKYKEISKINKSKKNR